MKAATISQLKKELAKLDEDELLDVCVRMAKFKVESKELLTYLLMKADDEPAYADELCDEIDEHLSVSGKIHKKTLRKVVRWMDKSLRFSGDKETELQVRIHFCQRIKEKRISFGAAASAKTCTRHSSKKSTRRSRKCIPICSSISTGNSRDCEFLSTEPRSRQQSDNHNSNQNQE